MARRRRAHRGPKRLRRHRRRGGKRGRRGAARGKRGPRVRGGGVAPLLANMYPYGMTNV